MPLMRITATSMELSSRQTAKCQTTGPVSSRPEDLCRATWLRRKPQLKTPVCVCVYVCVLAFHLHQCVFLTPSNARSGSALQLSSCHRKDKSSWPPKHHLHYKRLEKQQPADGIDEGSAFTRMLDAADARVQTPADVVLQMPSAQLEPADHGRGNWKEANM